MAVEIGIDPNLEGAVKTSVVAIDAADWRAWLVAEGLLENAVAQKFSDREISFFTEGVFTQRAANVVIKMS